MHNTSKTFKRLKCVVLLPFPLVLYCFVHKCIGNFKSLHIIYFFVKSNASNAHFALITGRKYGS